MRISDWSSDVCSSDLASPDADAVFRRQIQRLARLYLEGLIPRVKIARDPSPLDRRRMRIGGDALRQILLAIVAPPHLRPAEDEAPVDGRYVVHRRSLTAPRPLQGVISDVQHREAGDTIAPREG